jgi:hypothetical protein
MVIDALVRGTVAQPDTIHFRIVHLAASDLSRSRLTVAGGAENRNQRSEVRGQRTEIRGRTALLGARKTSGMFWRRIVTGISLKTGGSSQIYRDMSAKKLILHASGGRLDG